MTNTELAKKISEATEWIEEDILELVERAGLKDEELKFLRKKGDMVMKKIVKDGWHLVYGKYAVYVEDGEVKRGISDGRTVYPYRKSGYGGWDLDTHMTIDALRSGLLRDTVIIM